MVTPIDLTDASVIAEAPASDALFYFVKDPTGTPVPRKTSLATFGAFLRNGSLAMTGNADWGGFDLVDVGKVIVGSSIDLGARLQVEGAVGQQIELRDTAVNGNTKRGFLTTAHLLIADQPLGLVYGRSTTNIGEVHIGGGHSSVNAATQISEYAAADNVTTTGTEMRRLTSAGVRIESGVTADATEMLDVVGNISKTGQLLWQSVTVTGNTTLTNLHHVVDCDASGGAITITLPAVATSAGFHYEIKKTDISGNAVTIDGNGSETIDGQTTRVLSTQYANLTISCNGTTWSIR